MQSHKNKDSNVRLNMDKNILIPITCRSTIYVPTSNICEFINLDTVPAKSLYLMYLVKTHKLGAHKDFLLKVYYSFFYI